MRTLVLLFTLFLLGCAKPGSDPYACSSNIPEQDGRPSILVIGDSISYGYLPYLKQSLSTYDVQHNPCNAFNSDITNRRIDKWLESRPRWDAITFNNGLWDIASWSYVNSDDYRHNLREIAQKIKEHTDHPLFVLTTEVPIGAEGRDSTAVPARNAIAIEVMDAEGIPYVDLYSFSLTIVSEHIDPTNVHWTPQGSEDLSVQVLNALNTNYGI